MNASLQLQMLLLANFLIGLLVSVAAQNGGGGLDQERVVLKMNKVNRGGCPYTASFLCSAKVREYIEQSSSHCAVFCVCKLSMLLTSRLLHYFQLPLTARHCYQLLPRGPSWPCSTTSTT